MACHRASSLMSSRSDHAKIALNCSCVLFELVLLLAFTAPDRQQRVEFLRPFPISSFGGFHRR